jgi:hypothetical protein
MKALLLTLLLIGILWLGALACESRVTPAFLLDTILPPRVLAATTPEERAQIQNKLRDPEKFASLGSTTSQVRILLVDPVPSYE